MRKAENQNLPDEATMRMWRRRERIRQQLFIFLRNFPPTLVDDHNVTTVIFHYFSRDGRDIFVLYVIKVSRPLAEIFSRNVESTNRERLDLELIIRIKAS